MEEVKNDVAFNEYMVEAKRISKEYDIMIENIRKQKNIKGRGEFPEEIQLRKKCDEEIKRLAKKYNSNF